MAAEQQPAQTSSLMGPTAVAGVAACLVPATQMERLAEDIANRVIKKLEAKKRCKAPSSDEKKRKKLREKIVKALREFNNNSQNVTQTRKWAEEHLRCNMQTFKEHVEQNFQPWMNWGNWGPGFSNWHLDHDKPIRDYDPNDPVEVRVVLHYTNFMPRRGGDNMEKGDKLPDGTRARDKRPRPPTDSDEEEPAKNQRVVSPVELGKPRRFYYDGIVDWVLAHRNREPPPLNTNWQQELVGTSVDRFEAMIQKALGLTLWRDMDKTWRLVVDGADSVDVTSLADLCDTFRHARWNVDIKTSKDTGGVTPFLEM